MLHYTKTAGRLLTAVILSLSVFGIAKAGNDDGKADYALSANGSNIFSHLDVGVSLGTTGIGIDLSTHITDHFRVRAGVDYMPRFAVPMSFSLQSYSDGVVHSGNFDKMREYMYRITRIDVDDKIEMDGKPSMTNFKMLFDVYPWASKGWRFTAGFYVGSRKIAKAANTMGEMPSLLAVNIYNNFFDFIMSDEAIDEPIYKYTDGEEFYLDPYLVEDLRTRLGKEGYMGIHVGDFKDGKPYMMQPDTDGMVKVAAFVNAFKPYVGLGYSGDIGKTKRLKLDVDCGMMIWGGAPSLIAHDGVDLTTEMKSIKGKPGDYVDFMTAFKVYPVVTVRVAYRLFK